MGFDTYDGKSHDLLKAILKELQQLNDRVAEMQKTLDSIDDNTMDEGKRTQRTLLRQSSQRHW